MTGGNRKSKRTNKKSKRTNRKSKRTNRKFKRNNRKSKRSNRKLKRSNRKSKRNNKKLKRNKRKSKKFKGGFNASLNTCANNNDLGLDNFFNGENSVYTGDMNQRTFGCRQDMWEPSCV